MTKAKSDKQKVNDKHIIFYNKVLDILEFILDKYSKELKTLNIEFTDMPKNSIAVLDFLISSIVRVQKGHRLALDLDNIELEDSSPKINIIEGINKDRI